MKKIFEIRNIIIVILIILLGLSIINPKGILPNRVKYETVKDSIPYPVHDTIPFEVEVEVPIEVEVPVEVEKLVNVPVYQNVDTLGILKVFYEKNNLKETLTLPNNIGTLVVNEVISENKVLSRTYSNIKVKKQVVLDTLRIPEPPKPLLYFGIDANFDKRNFMSNLGVGLMYKTKTEKIYKLGVGVNNTVINDNSGILTPYLGGGVYWKINLKKK
jgi:hypothetical protein